MPILRKLGIAVALCALAAIAGLSIAYLTNPRIAAVGVLPRPAAIVAPSTALPLPTAPAPTAPRPLPTARPIAVAPSPAIRARTAGDVLEQVKATLAHLQSGTIDASIDYPNANRSSAKVKFDLGDSLRTSRFEINTTYTGTGSSQTAQRITIDDRSWQRLGESAWAAQPAEESARGELEAFLPHFDTSSSLDLGNEAELLALRWSDAQDTENVLLIDPDTNIPRQLRQLTRSTGLTFTMDYTGWNTPVQIQPPV